MRCPECGKFRSMDFSEPEVGLLQIDDDGQVTVEVHLERTCSECGAVMKEADLTMEEDLSEEVAEHKANNPDAEHTFDINEDSVEQIEEGGGRYAKSYFGATVAFSVTCSCTSHPVVESTVEEKVPASCMEEVC